MAMITRNLALLVLVALASCGGILWLTVIPHSGASAPHATAPPLRADEPPRLDDGRERRRPLQPLASTTPLPSPTESEVSAFFGRSPKVTCPSLTWTKVQIQALRLSAAHGRGVDQLLAVVHGYVLNVTDFIHIHPGGPALNVALDGVDGAEHFIQFHQMGTVGTFSNFCVGTFVRNAP